jgi:hypothetical protein
MKATVAPKIANTATSLTTADCPFISGAMLGKVDVCHIPPGNPANAHTINVSENAVPAHLAHGDTLGPCGVTGQSCTALGGICLGGCDPNLGQIEVEGPFSDCSGHCCVPAG